MNSITEKEGNTMGSAIKNSAWSLAALLTLLMGITVLVQFVILG